MPLRLKKLAFTLELQKPKASSGRWQMAHLTVQRTQLVMESVSKWEPIQPVAKTKVQTAVASESYYKIK